MNVTPLLIEKIMNKLHQPVGYKTLINFVMPHGKGVVVGFTVIQPPLPGVGIRTEYRCAGFIEYEAADDGIHCKYDMIV